MVHFSENGRQISQVYAICNVIDVGHQLRTSGDIFSSNPQAQHLAILEVQLPFSAARREQCLTISELAHGLVVHLAGLSTNYEGEHETLAAWLRYWQSKHDAHRYIDDPHGAGL